MRHRTPAHRPAAPVRGIAPTLSRAAELQGRGDFAGALALFDQVLRVQPRHALGLVNRGICLIHLGDCARAIESLSLALPEAPRAPEIYLNRGMAHSRLGHCDAALADYDAAITLRPAYLEAVFNRAVVLATIGRTEEAVAGYGRVLDLQPTHAEALCNRALAFVGLERFAAALSDADHAVSLAPSLAEAHNNRGLALRHMLQLDEALDSFERAIALRPNFAAARINRGWVLLSLGRPTEALRSLEAALELQPESIEALNHLGAVFKTLGRREESLASLQRALTLDPRCADALGNLGVLMLEAHRYPQAIDYLQRLRVLAPDHDYAQGNLLEAQLRCCDWTEYAARCAAVAAAIAQKRRAIRPFSALTVIDDPALQLLCSRLFAQHEFSAAAAAPAPQRRQPRPRIRIAYVSGDLRDHAVCYLTAGMFERHDRRHFEIIAISLQPDPGSAIGSRVRRAVDEFIDVSASSDLQVASLMRDLSVDIAVDLSGYTGAGRAGIFVHRAAPIQVNYLGFPATMGIGCMDYLIADDFLIPQPERVHYAEQVVYLPHSFQANDDRRHIDPDGPSRLECGLPPQGRVLCSFSSSYKLTPSVFEIWLRLLGAHPDCVLWLVGDNERAEENLRHAALARGIAPDRIVFARVLPYASHLARLRLADLCLDTLPFNGGTTASDALWAGVPLLTCSGSALASRMAGSLLRAVGLAELTTYSLEDYESLALRLLADPPLLAGLRARLAANRSTAPLFDTPRFCRGIEAAYSEMWRRYLRGEAPASFAIAADQD